MDSQWAVTPPALPFWITKQLFFVGIAFYFILPDDGIHNNVYIIVEVFAKIDIKLDKRFLVRVLQSNRFWFSLVKIYNNVLHCSICWGVLEQGT